MHDAHGPSPGLLRVIRILEFPATLIGKLAGWLVLPLVGALVYVVVSRYVFNKPTISAYDMTYMFAGALFMLGSAWALQKGSHVRADFVMAGLRPRWQALMDAVLYVVLYFPAMILFLNVRPALRGAILAAVRAVSAKPLDAAHLPTQDRDPGHGRPTADPGGGRADQGRLGRAPRHPIHPERAPIMSDHSPLFYRYKF